MNGFICAIFTLGLVKAAEIFYSTGVELTNVYPYQAQQNFYSVLDGQDNHIRRKQYSQFKSAGIENYLLNLPMAALDSPFTDLQRLIISEKVYEKYINPVEEVFVNNGLSSTTVVINNGIGNSVGASGIAGTISFNGVNGLSSVISISNGGTSTSTEVTTQDNNSFSTSRADGNQAIILNNNASGRMNGGTPSSSDPSTPSPSAPITTQPSPSTTPISQPTSSSSPPFTSKTPSKKSSSRTLQLSMTFLLITLLF